MAKCPSLGATGQLLLATLAVTALLQQLRFAAGQPVSMTANLRTYRQYTQEVNAALGDELSLCCPFSTGSPRFGKVASNGTHAFFAESLSHRIHMRRIIRSADGSSISTGPAMTIVPGLVGGFAGDGLNASLAKVNSPGGLALSGNWLYCADTGNCRVRAINILTWKIYTVVGNGSCTGKPILAPNQPWDNAVQAGTLVPLLRPTDVAADNFGYIYIADSGNRRVLKYTPGTPSRVITLAGPGPLNPPAGFTGDGGLAKDALLLNPVAVSAFPYVVYAGDGLEYQYTVVYIADQGAHVVRQVSGRPPNVVITTVAGKWGVAAPDEAAPYTSAQPAKGAPLRGPRGIAVDPRDGLSLWIADFAHVHQVVGGSIVTVTTNKRYPLSKSPPGVPLYSLNLDRFKHVSLVNDEAYSGVAAYHLWIVGANAWRGGSGRTNFDQHVAVSTVNLESPIRSRKPQLPLNSLTEEF